VKVSQQTDADKRGQVEDDDDDDDDDDDNNNNNNNNNNNISKSFRKYVSSIPGNHEVRELKKTAILGTAHILWKVPT
jgi:hypothetical protein